MTIQTLRDAKPETAELAVRWLFLIITVFGLLGIFVSVRYEKMNLSESVFAAIIFFFLTERLLDVILAYISKNHLSAVNNSIMTLAQSLATSDNLIVFERPVDAMNYIKSHLQNARSVQDTFFRVGAHLTYKKSGDEAVAYLESLSTAVRQGCRFTGIVTDASMELYDYFRTKAGKNYSFHNLKSGGTPLLNVTIVEYYGGQKELLFGWDYDSLDDGLVFATKSERAVSYFNSYFQCLLKECQPVTTA
jgi:hypothetical protein